MSFYYSERSYPKGKMVLISISWNRCSCGRPPGLVGAATAYPLLPRLPRAPTRGAPTGGRPPGGSVRGNHISVITTPHAHDDQNPVGAALVAARRGAGDAVTADGLSRWIAVLTTPRLPNDKHPVGAALVAARMGLWARQPRTRYCRASPGRPQEAPLQVAARRGVGAREPHLRYNHATRPR